MAFQTSSLATEGHNLQALCSLLSICHSPTTAYHPQSNGLVERLHRRLKEALKARAASSDWFTHLPWVMLGIRASWREDAEFSPAEAVFGSQPVLPGQFLSAPEPPSPTFLREFQGVLANRRPPAPAHHSLPGLTELPEELLLARYVLVRRDAAQPPLSPAYDGPFLVLERSLRFFKLQLGGKTDVISTLRLKACHTPPDVTAAVPPRRGRPRSAPPLETVASAPAPPRASAPASPRASVPPSPARLRRVSFAWPPATAIPASVPPVPTSGSGRPVRSVKRPVRYSS